MPKFKSKAAKKFVTKVAKEKVKQFEKAITGANESPLDRGGFVMLDSAVIAVAPPHSFDDFNDISPDGVCKLKDGIMDLLAKEFVPFGLVDELFIDLLDGYNTVKFSRFITDRQVAVPENCTMAIILRSNSGQTFMSRIFFSIIDHRVNHASSGAFVAERHEIHFMGSFPFELKVEAFHA